MSLRELKSLNVGKEPHVQGSHLRSGKMEDSETASNQHLSVNTDLKALVRALRVENEQLKLQNHEIEGKLEVLECAYEESIRLEGLLVTAPTEAELSRLRALEEARAEHQRTLRREQDMADRERNIARAATEEKATLEKELRDIHVELAECKAAMSEASVYDDEESHTTTGCGGGAEVNITNSGVLPWVTTTTRSTAGEWSIYE